MTTVLITGASSGYGLETARHFHAQGWSVIAAMRSPRAGLLPEGVRLLPLDVTDPTSIAAAIAAAGPIDVLVNNAGIGLVGAFEAAPMGYVRNLFETNTFGTMAMAQAVIPQMRARRERVIPAAYADFAASIFAAFANPPLTTRESDAAATEGADQLRYPAGHDAVMLAAA